MPEITTQQLEKKLWIATYGNSIAGGETEEEAVDKLRRYIADFIRTQTIYA